MLENFVVLTSDLTGFIYPASSDGCGEEEPRVQSHGHHPLLPDREERGVVCVAGPRTGNGMCGVQVSCVGTRPLAGCFPSDPIIYPHLPSY